MAGSSYPAFSIPVPRPNRLWRTAKLGLARSLTSGAADRRAALHGKANVQDVALPHLVVLALDADLARGLGLFHRSVREQLVIGDHLRADEPALEVGVDRAGGFGRPRAPPDLPSARLVLAGREEYDEVERAVAGTDHSVQARLFHPELLQQRPGLLWFHLGGLRLDGGVHPHNVRPQLARDLRPLFEIRDDDLRLQRQRPDALQLRNFIRRQGGFP